MRISSSDLINLPVETQSSAHLGRVSSFDLDLDGHKVVRYYVKTGLIKGLWHQQLLIDPIQVISISKEKMVVEDNLAAEPATQVKEVPFAAPAAK
ncbi:MAG: hypothetical protein A3J59_04940 [Candidatus Buchananbacteria bacterium RIFCSPHIGHO2_02_FULL_56_16]|uniref:PRC-barrel domain-containing protein n=1 Tax=Candidatus Buchananbacteria bacterium RIFCSPHIGHO2_02_FULL_56_16 TaxID=1797542 RepID=A0A1G1YGZ5_9BACT|nr:MAG: hypothetical protein A3J59_04940 [Candidatus Buchananbacteria bacterium RIFCSPHIGHO2_02_FULL_56_16]